MTYKEFRIWCNDRSFDGCWGSKEAITCITIIEYMNKIPFWKRKKEWEKVSDRIVNDIVEPTNKKIEEFKKENNLC